MIQAMYFGTLEPDKFKGLTQLILRISSFSPLSSKPTKNPNTQR